MTNTTLPTYFISHGGGPWPWLKKEMPYYDILEKSLKDIVQELKVKPKAILMISGHWETENFTVMASPNPPMLYDYGGFPEHTYHVKYPAPGSPELAKKVKDILDANGFPCSLDTQRGFDHGTFTPLVVMYPNADIPVVQLSMRSDYDPKTHFEVGRLLSSLRKEGVLIIGSGLTYHNLRNFGRSDSAQLASSQFDKWLTHVLVDLSPSERHQELLNWSKAPAAREAHPQEDHFIPLLVAAAAAENEKTEVVYHEKTFFGKLTVSSFRFGEIL